LKDEFSRKGAKAQRRKALPRCQMIFFDASLRLCGRDILQLVSARMD
jgi:hypothetical protein